MLAMPQPFGGDMTLYSATQIPHILKVMVALTLGIPEHHMRVVAPVGRRRVRIEAQRVRRGTAVRGARPQARRPGALERGPLRERDGDDPRPRPDPEDRARRRRRRQAHRDPRPPARRHGRLPAARDARHPVARRLPLRRGVRPAQGVRLLVHVGVHDDDAHRRLPRRRTPRGHVRDRAGDGLPGGEDRRRPARAAAPQLHRHRQVSVRGVQRADVRLGQPRRRGDEGRRDARL